jgi:hypothetical protein
MQDSATLDSITRMLAQHRSVTSTLAAHGSVMQEMMGSSVADALAQHRSAMQGMMGSSVPDALAQHRSVMQGMMGSSVPDALAQHRSVMQGMMGSPVADALAQHRSLMQEVARSSIAETLAQYRSVSAEMLASSVVHNLFEHRTLIQEAMLTFRVADVFGDSKSSITDAVKASIGKGLWPDQLLRNLQSVSAREFADTLEEPQNSKVMTTWSEAAATTLGLSPPIAEMLGDLVDEEFSSARAVVEKFDSVSLETVALFDVLLALLARLGDLGRHPKVQAFVIQLLIASIPALGVGIWQSRGSDKQHAEEIAILKEIADDKGEDSKEIHHIRAVVVRPKAHLRATATSKSRSLGILHAGDEILILGRSNGWLLVRAGVTGGEIQTGWVYGQLVKAIV